MLSVLAGGAYLLLVVTLVKAIKSKGNQPYFIGYFVVVLAGFYGMISVCGVLDLLIARNPVDAVLSLVMGIVALKVAYWGLNTFKHLYMEV